MQSTAKVTELQTLRGLAALLVSASHILQVYQVPRAWRVGIDAMLNAHAAVVVFFVLSGYVLSASLLKSDVTSDKLTTYYVRRLFRIYPAVWAVSLISIGIILLLGGAAIHPQASPWFSPYMQREQMNIGNIALSLMALKTYLIPPLRTILTELIGSFLLPIFVIFVVRWPKLLAPLLVVLVAVAFAAKDAPFHLSVLCYLVDFALGLGLALAPASIRRLISRYWAPLAIGSILLLLFFRAVWFMALTGQLQPLAYEYESQVPALVEGLASVALIGVLVAKQNQIRWLASGPLATLGDISYSVYLIHFPLMAGFIWGLSPMMRTLDLGPLEASALLLVATLGATMALSTLSYRWIELPGIAIGQKVVEVAKSFSARRKRAEA